MRVYLAAVLIIGCLDVAFGVGGAGAGGSPETGGAGARAGMDAVGGAPNSGGAPATGGGTPECVAPPGPCGDAACEVELLLTGEDSNGRVRVFGDTAVFTSKGQGLGNVVRSLPVDAPLSQGSLKVFDADPPSASGRYGDLGGGDIVLSEDGDAWRCELATGNCASLFPQPIPRVHDALVLSDASGARRFVWAQFDDVYTLADPPLPVPSLSPSGGIDLGDEDADALRAFAGERERVWLSAGMGPLVRVTYTSNGASKENLGELVVGAATVDAGCSTTPRLYAAVASLNCPGGSFNCAQLRWSDVAVDPETGLLEPTTGFAQFGQGPLVASSFPASFDADRDYVYLAAANAGLRVYDASTLSTDAEPVFVFGSGNVVAVDASHEEYLFFTINQGGNSYLGRWRKERLSGPPTTSGTEPR